MAASVATATNANTISRRKTGSTHTAQGKRPSIKRLYSILTVIHTYSPHSPILLAPGGYAHGDAVHNIKQRNHSDDPQKAIDAQHKSGISSGSFLPSKITCYYYDCHYPNHKGVFIPSQSQIPDKLTDKSI